MTLKRCYKQNNLLGDNHGLAAIEFALLLPILIILFLGMIEIGRYALFQQKLRTASYAMSDFVTRDRSVSIAALNNYADAVEEIMKPFDFNGTIIFTGVASISQADERAQVRGLPGAGNRGNVNDADVSPRCRNGCIVWQHTATGNDRSKIGQVGSRARFPNNYRMRDTQTVIVSEIYGNYSPVLAATRNFIRSIVPSNNYSYSVYKPRQNAEQFAIPPQ